MQRGSSSSSTGSNKSIKTEFMIRRYIHLKVRLVWNWQLTVFANITLSMYWIFLKPEGVQKMNKHTRDQPINKKASACRWGSSFALLCCFLTESMRARRQVRKDTVDDLTPVWSCAGLWPTLSLFSVSCITLKCRVCQYVNVLVYFLCVHLMDLRGRLSSSSSLIPITKANSNIWQ